MGRPRIGLVLAAGKGTRLKSELPKVLHPILGKSMLQRVLESLAPLGLDKVILVVGHQAQRVQQTVSGFTLPYPLEFIVQEPQLGTGHALMQVLPVLPPSTEAEVLITCGDMPLVPTERYRSLLEAHARNQTQVSLVTVSMDNPTGYGRIVTTADGQFQRITEEKDASPEEKAIPWVNAGIYAAQWPVFSQYFAKLSQNNAQGEFYLTDVMEMLAEDFGPKGVSVVNWPNPDELLGINSRHQLAQASTILSRWTAEHLMSDGVTLINPESITVAPEVRVGPDSVLYPGCYLEGEISIGTGCEIGPNTLMRGTVSVGDNCRVVQSYLERSVTVGNNTYIGPFAHLRDNAFIGEQVRIGNFVEVKETRFGSRSNAAHLCYLGDADVGDDVNMGAGSIVANYDPILDQKYRTTIADGVKVGCNSVLVAPVELQERSCIAAGSVITQAVAPWDLAIARARQSAVSGWVKRKLAPDTETASDTSCPVS